MFTINLINDHPLKCIVRGCGCKGSSPSRRLYRFPKDGIMRRKWCDNLRIDEDVLNTKARVCSSHFEPHAINIRKVKREAVPTLKLGHKWPAKHPLEVETYPSKVWRKCGVKGCDVKRTKQNRFFAIPQDSSRREAWLSVLDIDCSTKHVYVCAKHFAPNDIGNFKLRKNAVPLKFGEDTAVKSPSPDVDYVEIEILDENISEIDAIEEVYYDEEINESESTCTCTCHEDFAEKESYYIRQIEALEEEIRLLKKSNKFTHENSSI